jgi:hypothetical protein
MYENEYMYAVERDPNSLAHYGIRGMKWGVRKAIESGNSARLSRQYAKAQKKLAKLESRAAKADKYKKRAIRYGIGAAAAGGLAAAGTEGVTRGISKLGSGVMNGSSAAGKALMGVRGNSQFAHKLRNAGVALNKIGQRGSDFHKSMAEAGRAVNQWGKGNSVGIQLARGQTMLGNKLMGTRGSNAVAKAARDAGVNMRKYENAAHWANRSNNTYARIAAGAVAAGLGAASARNAYRAATAQKKAAKFKSAMNEAFKGTQYASGGNRQGKKRRRR